MSPIDLPLPIVAFSLTVFFIGGTIKGTLGIGMPLFVVPVMATIFEPVTVIALLLVPILLTNFLQMLEGGLHRVTFNRFRGLLITMIFATVIGTQILAKIEPKLGLLALGCIVTTFCILQMLPLRLSVPKRFEVYFGPIVGMIAGLLGGVSTLFGPPITMYLISLRVTNEEFIAAIAQLFFIAGAILYITLAISGVLTLELMAASFVVTLPALVGLALGRKLRSRIQHEATFQRILIMVLLIVGLNLIRRSVL